MAHDEEEIFYDSPKFVGTYGGEAWVDDIFWDSYGLDFEEFSLHDIQGDEFEEIALAMMNHLLFSRNYEIVHIDGRGDIIKRKN